MSAPDATLTCDWCGKRFPASERALRLRVWDDKPIICRACYAKYFRDGTGDDLAEQRALGRVHGPMDEEPRWYEDETTFTHR